MYKWLEKQLEGRSVAEMSIMHTLVGVCSLLAIGLFFFGIGSSDPTLFSIALSLWFLFLVWLWAGLVRIAWKSEHERLGAQIFRYLQIAIFVIIVLTVFPAIRSIEEFEIIRYLILAFDIAIAWLAINFLILGWCARCKIPLRVYCEITSIIGMVIFQIWLLN